MTDYLNNTAIGVYSMGAEPQYDAAAKRVLSDIQILA